MSDMDYRPDPDDVDDAEFEQALRALRRRRVVTAIAVLGTLTALLTVPWSRSVAVTGRVAPARWARVRSEVPGVIRELKCKSGAAVQEGDVIAVLDSDEQRDALEAARLALTRERQKLADLELRLQQNRILREGSDAAVQEAERRVTAAERVEDVRIDDLEPAASSVLESVRGFTVKARSQLVIDGRTATPLHGEPILQAADDAMAGYVQRAEEVADHLGETAGDDVGRDLRARLDSARFTFALADSTMREIALKHELVVRGLLAPVELREIVDQLERESRDLTQGFAGLAAVARGLTGSPDERRGWIRTAEEKRELLRNETERVEAERETVESSIAQAELAVRAAERNQGKTAIHAPISGTLSDTQLAELDVVEPNASVGIIEDADQLVLKVRVTDLDWPLVAEGQRVAADAGDGRTLNGTIAWKVPRVGQEVRDQQWNVLVEVDDVTDVEPGTKVQGAIAIGRESLLGRWLSRRQESQKLASVAGTRLAFVNDPTEQHVAAERSDLAATDPLRDAHVTDLGEAVGSN